MPPVTLHELHAAQARLRAYLEPTPLESAPGSLGARTWLKLENANKTHSFKVRGALNALLSMDDAARARGVVTASSGNHAQGIAYAASVIGVSAQIHMPEAAPQKKINGVKRWGGEVVLHETYDEGEEGARRVAQETGRVYISPYNHPDVVAGQGTIGLELVATLPELARVIVPVGGGGLIGGIALAVKETNPSIRVIGVCAAESPDIVNAILGTEHPVGAATFADALPGAIETGSITLDLVRQYVDELVMIDEPAIGDAMRWMVDAAGWMAEGGGVVGIAALLSFSEMIEKDDVRGDTAVVISGGNVDGKLLKEVLMSRYFYLPGTSGTAQPEKYKVQR